MNEELLQTIVEKLESLEIAMLKHDNDAQVKLSQDLSNKLDSGFSSLQKRASDIEVTNGKIAVALAKLEVSIRALNNPMGQTIIHRHRIHRGVWVALGLLIGVLILIMRLVKYLKYA